MNFNAADSAEREQKLRNHQKPVKYTEDDNEEHYFEEGPDHVSRRDAEYRYGENRRRGALHDGIAHKSEGVAHAFQLVLAGRADERVGDVRREVDAEANAHDDVDHRDAVQVDPPPGHESYDPYADGRDAQGDEDGARERRNQQQRDEEHGGRRQSQVAQGGRRDNCVYVIEDE